MAKLEVTVTVTRNGGKAATYPMQEAGASKKGTYAVFAPGADTPDLPEFAKVYVKVEPTAATPA